MKLQNGAENGQPRREHYAHTNGETQTKVVQSGFQLATRRVDRGLKFPSSGIEILTSNQFYHDEFPRCLRMSFSLFLRDAHVPQLLRIAETIKRECYVSCLNW